MLVCEAQTFQGTDVSRHQGFRGGPRNWGKRRGGPWWRGEDSSKNEVFRMRPFIIVWLHLVSLKSNGCRGAVFQKSEVPRMRYPIVEDVHNLLTLFPSHLEASNCHSSRNTYLNHDIFGNKFLRTISFCCCIHLWVE